MTSDLTASSERVLAGCLKLLLVTTIAIGCLVAATVFGVVWRERKEDAPVGSIGDPSRGKALVGQYGCTGCHAIPGASPDGAVGPPLTAFGSRTYIAGKIANTPIRLEEWIRHPQQQKPGTAMPDLGVSDRDGRDIAAYLLKLKRAR